jgi:hypothetical protein
VSIPVYSIASVPSAETVYRKCRKQNLSFFFQSAETSGQQKIEPSTLTIPQLMLIFLFIFYLNT